jgi:hypothetical protein
VTFVSPLGLTDPALDPRAFDDQGLIELWIYSGSHQAFARDRRARLVQILDLIFEDDRLNVYAGKLEVRPPGAPTTGAILALSRRESFRR